MPNSRNNISLEANYPRVATPQNSVTGQIFATLLTLFFVFILLWSGPQLLFALQSNSWPTATGLITKSGIGYQDSHSSTAGGVYTVTIEYQFKVNNVNHTGRLISFGVSDAVPNLNRGADGSQALIDEYPVGAEVAVHYNSNNPAQCVLRPGPTIGLYFIIAFSLFAIFCHLQYAYEQWQGVGTRVTTMTFVRTFGFMGFFIVGLLSLIFPLQAKMLGNLIQPDVHVASHAQSEKAPEANSKK
jgi:Protein of unknown function (DUF3592)